MKNNQIKKKALGPVIAILLLLIVVVVAGIGFQTWYQNYSSQLLVENDKSAQNLVQPKLDKIIGNKLYVKSPNENITIKSIKIDGEICELNGSYGGKIAEIEIPDECLDLIYGDRAEILIDTGNELLSGNIGYKKVYVTEKFDCSNLEGGDWILVPGNLDLGTSDFCVMKYEAKFVDYVGKVDGGYNTLNWEASTGNMNITSTNIGSNIGNINFTDAWNACKNLGTQYHMITNREWMTIARNIETENFNWNSSTVGLGSIFLGHSDGNPNKILNVTNVNDPYDGTEDIYPSNQRRTFILSNSEEIWDFSGNSQEWVDLMENGESIPNPNACGSTFFFSFFGNDGYSECSWLNGFAKTGALDKKYEIGPLGDYNNYNGIGQIYNHIDSNTVLIRGGAWDYGAGIYDINLYCFPSFSYMHQVSFRCTYTP